jgi:guanylate kinase
VPGSFQDLQDRLAQRMTESSPEMKLRLNAAAAELEHAKDFDRQVVNSQDKLAQAVAEIDRAIAEERQRQGCTSIQLL